MENLKYMKELIKRIDASAKAVDAADIPADVSKQERLIHPVLKELQMVAPRVWDDFIKKCSEQRAKISRGE